MSEPRALVTGGAGFLGSHLCDALLAEGYPVGRDLRIRVANQVCPVDPYIPWPPDR